MRIIKAIALFFALASAFISIYAVKQSAELKALDRNNKENEEKIKSIKADIKRIRVVNIILNDAVAGLTTAKPTTIKRVNEVVKFLNSGAAETELQFAECWDRRVRTTNWGSMGPSGILDECIDKIAKKDSAILLRGIENAAESARSNCALTALNAAQERERCGIDKDFRLLSAANRALFSALTEENWDNTNRSVLSE